MTGSRSQFRHKAFQAYTASTSRRFACSSRLATLKQARMARYKNNGGVMPDIMKHRPGAALTLPTRPATHVEPACCDSSCPVTQQPLCRNREILE